jgi:hypothetical protein
VLRIVPLARMPSPLPRQVQWNLFARTVPSSSAFPEIQAGRPLHHPFRGLLSVYSRYGLHARRVAVATLYTEGSSSFVASTAASIATGWSEPVPGRDFHPLWTSTFSRRTELSRLGTTFLAWSMVEAAVSTVVRLLRLL